MRTRLSALPFVVASCVTLAGQSSPPQGAPPRGRDAEPTFRSGASYVRVDMYATRDGQPVLDLKPEEIQVLEDDVAQSIESFEHVQVRTAQPQDARIEPNTVEASRQMAAEARARVFVIFLDTYHTGIEGSANMRLPLVRFLDRLLGPDDLVAVMTPEMSAADIAFGRKTTVISNIMQAEWAWGRRGRPVDNDPKEDLYDACYVPDTHSSNSPGRGTAGEMKARRREKLTLDALEDLVVHLGGVREERKAVLTVTDGWVLFRPNPSLAPSRRDAGPPTTLPGRGRPRPTSEDTGRLSGSTMIECETDRIALSLVDHDLKLRNLTEEANRGNVTFYPVVARGLVPFDSDIGPDPPLSRAADADSLRTRHDSLRLLADNTDGMAVINTNDIEGPLKRITDDLSSYYLLGYYSTNTKLDGRFRSIAVRVNRPGVRVRARRGYRGRTAEEVLNGTAGSGESPETTAVVRALNTVANVDVRSPFRIRTASWAHHAPEGARGTFWIVGELDFRTRRELAWTAGAVAEVVVLAADGQQVLSRTIDVTAADGAFGIQVPESGTLPAGEYAVQVRLRSDGDTGLTLSDLARVIVPEGVSPVGEAILWRRGRSTGPKYLRTADPRFARSDRLRLELPTSPESSGATARLLDRAGNPLTVPVQVSERTEPSGELRWIVVDITLAPMAAGEYAIEVTEGATRQLTAFRVVP